jgi:nicotinamidase-related amidase
MTTAAYAADRTALLIVDPYNDFMSEGGKFYETLIKHATAAFEQEGMHAAHEVNGPRFAHAILTTEELLVLPRRRGSSAGR